MTNPLYDALFAPQAGQDRPFMTLPGGDQLSAADFHDTLARFANALRALDVGPGERVAVQASKSPQMLAIYGAAVASGAVFLPLNSAYTPEELEYFITDCGARLLLVDPARISALTPLAEKLGVRLESLGEGGSFDALADTLPASFTPEPRSDDDLTALLYTSGTTGRSKGAMLSQRNLLSNAEALVDLWRFTSEDVLLHALPIFHTHGLFVASNVVLLSRAQMIFLPKFELDQVFAFLPQATTMMGVPTFYTRLLGDARLCRETVDHMRLFVSGSAPLLAETHREWSERTGHAILERYGMTETNMLTSNPYEGARRPGTVGHPLPGVSLRIADPESGAALPQGETGMIEVRGPNVFQGYWQMPEKTAAEFRADGYFMTGDLGMIDDQGYVNIVGRAKDLIISGGYNVYPKEIELVLDDMPGVVESAVIGLPHPDFGEAVVAVLVPDKATPDISAIESGLSDKLARYKQPKAYIVLPELPRNTMGKVQKAALRNDYAAYFKESAQ
ncbi:malonate--CoA ligase [Roseinatronobacter alkalisoli]|uniref:Malonyl-CoA synthase n=1 Tax=Roseinatronobacter alkalisoli TaxID=3028235 RepID=A0ABT5TD26_9RHOB|nr:malonyl-CoA synthase [Roseinatronobacter sp. HJB301]MDD7973027.1 malonyl-CoA synthase [Roseinatronobacter sp. HJB301]